MPVASSWIWFDLDDTLHDMTSAVETASLSALKKIIDKTGISAAQVINNWNEAYDRQRKAEFSDGRSSNENRRERFGVAMKGHGLPRIESDIFLQEVVDHYNTMYLAALKLKPRAAETLRLLKEKGYRLALLTDGPHDGQLSVVETLGIKEYFEDIYTAGGMRKSKAQGMMLAVLAELGASPKSVTMVGDSLRSDIAPAEEMGIRSVWYNEKRLPNDTGRLEVYALDLLPEVIEKYAA